MNTSCARNLSPGTIASVGALSSTLQGIIHSEHRSEIRIIDGKVVHVLFGTPSWGSAGRGLTYKNATLRWGLFLWHIGRSTFETRHFVASHPSNNYKTQWSSWQHRNHPRTVYTDAHQLACAASSQQLPLVGDVLSWCFRVWNLNSTASAGGVVWTVTIVGVGVWGNGVLDGICILRERNLFSLLLRFHMHSFIFANAIGQKNWRRAKHKISCIGNLESFLTKLRFLGIDSVRGYEYAAKPLKMD